MATVVPVRTDRAPAGVVGDIGPRAATTAVTVVTAAFVALYGYLALHRFDAFQMHAFDLGIFDQGLWLLSRLKEPFVTVRGLDLFADHASFVMVLLTPLYWLWADVRMLIGITTLVVAAGIPLTYLVGRAAGLTRRWSAIAAAGFSLHPAAAWNVWDSFHPEVLAIPLLLGAVWALLRSRSGLAFALIGVVLLTKEDAGLVVVPLGLYAALGMRRKVGWWIAGAGTAAFIVAFTVVLPGLSPTGTLLYTGRYAQLGEGLGGIVWGLVTKPQGWVPDLFSVDRLGYLAALVLPVPVAALAPRFLAVAGPALLANLLSTHVYQYDIRYHYTAYLLPVIVVAAVFGARRLTMGVAGARAMRRLAAGVLVAAVVGHVLAAPFPIGPRHSTWSRLATPTTEQHQALALVPPDVAVAATSGFVPHLTHRDVVYLFPTPWLRDNYAYPGAALPDASAVEWVIATLAIPEEHRLVLERLQLSSFDTVYAGESIVVLRRR